ncbi:VOC family protein [Streptomyces sp. NPDC097640]|uniref:VOC family protein n=1 Tax=Streptomyces sp. NPDC097640 TaxID=3157229 RepID=UPI0033216881
MHASIFTTRGRGLPLDIAAGRWGDCARNEGLGAFDRQAGFELSPSSDPRTGKLPLHIDVNATDHDQDAELERLLALGARPADVGLPESNEFCLLRPRLQHL